MDSFKINPTDYGIGIVPCSTNYFGFNDSKTEFYRISTRCSHELFEILKTKLKELKELTDDHINDVFTDVLEGKYLSGDQQKVLKKNVRMVYDSMYFAKFRLIKNYVDYMVLHQKLNDQEVVYKKEELKEAVERIMRYLPVLVLTIIEQEIGNNKTKTIDNKNFVLFGTRAFLQLQHKTNNIFTITGDITSIDIDIEVKDLDIMHTVYDRLIEYVKNHAFVVNGVKYYLYFIKKYIQKENGGCLFQYSIRGYIGCGDVKHYFLKEVEIIDVKRFTNIAKYVDNIDGVYVQSPISYLLGMIDKLYNTILNERIPYSEKPDAIKKMVDRWNKIKINNREIIRDVIDQDKSILDEFTSFKSSEPMEFLKRLMDGESVEELNKFFIGWSDQKMDELKIECERIEKEKRENEEKEKKERLEQSIKRIEEQLSQKEEKNIERQRKQKEKQNIKNQ